MARAAAATNVAGTEPSAPARPRPAEATRTGAAGAVHLERAGLMRFMTIGVGAQNLLAMRPPGCWCPTPVRGSRSTADPEPSPAVRCTPGWSPTSEAS
jgi:hypothetical protein